MAHSDLAACDTPPEHDGDERDHRLRQGRAYGRQDGPDRTFGQLELVAEPLDAVGEQLRADQDHHERNGQQTEVQLTLQRSGPRSIADPGGGAQAGRAGATWDG